MLMRKNVNNDVSKDLPLSLLGFQLKTGCESLFGSFIVSVDGGDLFLTNHSFGYDTVR